MLYFNCSRLWTERCQDVLQGQPLSPSKTPNWYKERQQWTKVKRNFVPGDIVLIVDNSAPRNFWIIGRITEALPDRRGLVRQVQIKTQTSTLCRPVTKI
ncbi:hypothetical protein N1851_013123 [Merluccius polli]|uniref:DUF5641 domain-containing protein n=1 Tax=Merluccius polli TaxID=89951 RepID=A0AA47P5H4_MERPO|nr:hypothetical protein N1851_013123 [Merluccius polli]